MIMPNRVTYFNRPIGGLSSIGREAVEFNLVGSMTDLRKESNSCSNKNKINQRN